MKNVRRIFTLALVLMMVLSLAVPAMAADYSITIKNAASGHTYDAYQIFSGTLSDNGLTLSDIKWGSAIYNDANSDGKTDGEGEYDYSGALIAALLADNEEIHLANDPATGEPVIVTVGSVLASMAGKSGNDAANEMATVLSEKLDPTGSLVLERIAAIIGTVTKTESGDTTIYNHSYMGNYAGTSTYDADSKIYTISNLPAGYYLVKDRDGTALGDGDFYTEYLINVAGASEIAVKGDGVTVDKKINDTVDGTYAEVEDFDINDTAYYMWHGELPSNLLDYDVYYYKFIDNMPVGMEFIRLEAVYVQNSKGGRIMTFMDMNDTDAANNELPDDIELDEEAKSNGSTTITLEFADLLTSCKDGAGNILIDGDSQVVVKYSALVSRNVTVHHDLVNDVRIEYSNNPNDPNGEGHGFTVPNYAHAFTFDLVIDKYDATDSAVKLQGAEFILYKSITTNGTPNTYYALVVTEEMIYQTEEDEEGNIVLKLDDKGQLILREGDLELNDGSTNTSDPNVGHEDAYYVNGHKLVPDYLGNIYGWSTDRTKASILDTDEKGYLYVGGLDLDTYTLEEVKAPDGYNRLNSPITVVITATYNGQPEVNKNNVQESETVNVKVFYSVDKEAASESNTVGIANAKGNVLPTTGGTGTTLFYVFGGILVAAALTLLVTKKRMSTQK